MIMYNKSPYGPSYKEIQEKKNQEAKERERTNVLLEELLAEVKKLVGAK